MHHRQNSSAWLAISSLADAVSSTSAAFCCVIESISDTAILIWSIPFLFFTRSGYLGDYFRRFLRRRNSLFSTSPLRLTRVVPLATFSSESLISSPISWPRCPNVAQDFAPRPRRPQNHGPALRRARPQPRVQRKQICLERDFIYYGNDFADLFTRLVNIVDRIDSVHLTVPPSSVSARLQSSACSPGLRSPRSGGYSPSLPLSSKQSPQALTPVQMCAVKVLVAARVCCTACERFCDATIISDIVLSQCRYRGIERRSHYADFILVSI